MVTTIPLPRRTWLLLVYSVPRHPSAARVHVWRKLKQLGAESIQDATWALPSSPRTAEHFRWLAAEIRELRGTAMLWEAKLTGGDEEDLKKRFEGPVEAGYRRLLAELDRDGADKAALSRRFQQLRARDYFGCALGRRARSALQGRAWR